MGMLILLPPAAERRIRREARSETLRERASALRRGGWTFAAIGKALGVSLERARQIVRKAERRKRDPHWYDGLPVRVIYFLYHLGLTSLPEIEAAHAVARLSRRELMHSPNFGAGACAAVIAWLARHGNSGTLNPRARTLSVFDCGAAASRRSLMPQKTDRRAANAAARKRLLDCRSKRPNGNPADERAQVAIAACAGHLRERGPLPARRHVFDQLIDLDVAFPGLSFRDLSLRAASPAREGAA